MKLLPRAFLVLIFASTLAFAGDSEFRVVVHAIESQYGVRHYPHPAAGSSPCFSPALRALAV